MNTKDFFFDNPPPSSPPTLTWIKTCRVRVHCNLISEAWAKTSFDALPSCKWGSEGGALTGGCWRMEPFKMMALVMYPLKTNAGVYWYDLYSFWLDAKDLYISPLILNTFPMSDFDEIWVAEHFLNSLLFISVWNKSSPLIFDVGAKELYISHNFEYFTIVLCWRNSQCASLLRLPIV